MYTERERERGFIDLLFMVSNKKPFRTIFVTSKEMNMNYLLSKMKTRNKKWEEYIIKFML